MELKELLLAEQSKRQNLRIVKYIGDDQKKFDQLFRIYIGNETPLAQRAAWAMSECVHEHPLLIKKYLERLLDHIIKEDLHQAIKRNGIRLFQFISVPDEITGKLADTCFRFLHSTDESLAVKSISIKLLSAICKKHPELLPEFVQVIEPMNEIPAPAIAAAIRFAEKELNRGKRNKRNYSSGAA